MQGCVWHRGVASTQARLMEPRTSGSLFVHPHENAAGVGHPWERRMLTRYRFLMTYIDVTLFCYYCVGGTVNRTNAFFLQLQASGLHHLSLCRKGSPPPSGNGLLLTAFNYEWKNKHHRHHHHHHHDHPSVLELFVSFLMSVMSFAAIVAGLNVFLGLLIPTITR